MEEKIYTIIIAEFCGEHLTREEADILKEWLGFSRENRCTYNKMKAWYEESAAVREKHGLDHAKAWQTILEKKGRRLRPARRKLLLRLAGVAAILLLSIGTGLFYLQHDAGNAGETELASVESGINVQLELTDGMKINLTGTADSITVGMSGERALCDSNGLVYENRQADLQKHVKVALNRLIVPVGAEYKVVLSDGTTVYLNAASELTYPASFTGSRREVLLKGEAYFEVKHDPGHRFVVRTSDMDIEVLGTIFNINSYAGYKTAATTLVEGKVKAECRGQVFELSPGEQICANRETGEVSVKQVDTQLFTSWKDGYYYFEAQKLEDIMEMVSHWYGFQVEFQDASLREVAFSGRFQRYEDVERIFRIFEQVERVRFTREGNLVRVSYK